MPLVDVVDSRSKLFRILQKRPDLKEECDIRLGDIIDYSPTAKGVEPFQFNKIRLLLSAITKSKGFPAKRYYTVTFFNFLMFGIPYATVLDWKMTMNIWENDQAYNNLMRLPMNEKPYYPFHFRWRHVIIRDVPDQQMRTAMGYMGSIPIFGQGLGIGVELWSNLTKRLYPIFENLLFYSGLADHIIICNWDKISEVLNKNGY